MTWQRIQLSRRKGARIPKGGRSCARGTHWGNPFRADSIYQDLDDGWTPGDRDLPRRVQALPAAQYLKVCRPSAAMCNVVAVEWFRCFCERWQFVDPAGFEKWLEPLRDCRYLACWCAPDQPCHVDVLIQWLERVYGDARSTP